MSETVATYEPDNCLKKGYSQIFREIGEEIRKNKWLIYQLFRRDFVSIYRQSLFGILWAFIVPIVSVGAFLLLGQSGIFITGNTGVPFAVYALLGLAFWQLFSAGVVASSVSLTQAGSMITKINFSKKALVIASMGKTLVAFIIQLFLAFLSFALFGVMPNVAIVLTPVLIIPLLLAMLGFGFILSLINVVMRDVGAFLPIAMTFLLFLTPVMYAAPSTGIMSLLTTYNPLYYMVSLPRDLILTGASTLWLGFLLSSVLSVVMFVVCLVAFHLTETRLSERI